MIDPDSLPGRPAGARTDAWRMRRPDPTDRVLPAGHGLRRWLGLAALGVVLCVARPAAPGFLTGRELAPGMRLGDRLAAGEHRIYPVRLRAGELLHVFVREDDGDLAVLLRDAGGALVAHADGPRTPQEDEELAAVARRDGDYRLEIAASRPGDPPGRYHLKIAELRPAGDRDRRLSQALAATQEAAELAPAPRQGIAARERSLALWRALGNGRRVAEALFQMGELRLILDENEPAAALLHQALAVYRTAGDRAGLAEALNEAGRADLRLLRPEEAMGHLDEGLPLAHAARDERLEIYLDENRAHALGRLGNPQAAIQSLQTAHQLAHARGDAASEAQVLNDLGAAWAALAERQRALDDYWKALDIAREKGLASLEATIWNNLGESHEALGQWEEAESNHRSALLLYRKLGLKEKEAHSLNSLGVVERRLGRYDAAARYFSRAIALGRRLGEPGSLDAAALASTHLAFLDLDRHLPEEALEAARQAQSLAPPGGDAETTTWHALGAARRALGDLPGAADAIARGLAASRARGNPADEADALFLLAETARDRGDLAGASKLAREAIGTVESLRARVAAEGLRTSFVASSQRFYELAIEILMDLDSARPRQGFVAEALGVAEQARARSLLDLLARADTVPGVHREPELAARERKSREAVSSAEGHRHELARAVPPRPASELAAAARDVDRAVAAYEEVETELADRSPSYASLNEARPLAAGDIASQVLDPDTLLLEFSLGGHRSYLWAFGQGVLTAYVLPPRQEVERAAGRFYEALTARNLAPKGETLAARRARIDQADRELPQAAEALSHMLLASAAERLGRRRLAVVADGLLHYIPFAALPEPGAGGLPLVAGHELVSLPSASVLAVLRREVSRRPRAPRTLAVLADPVFSRDDPRVTGRSLLARSAGFFGHTRGAEAGEAATSLARLRFSREEAEQIVMLVPAAGDRLEALDFDASRELVLSGKLDRYRYVHLATHAFVESSPRLYGLALSMVDRRGRPQNGFLRLADIYDLDLDADLVVLSACRTALGREIPGEGLIGLTRGFMHAGAARVVASLWSVDDRSTAELMKRFYRSMLIGHRTPAAALREAQVSMARERRWGLPYEWAAFSLQGEWR